MAYDKQYIRKSILIVDDEFDIVTLIKASLQNHGFNTLAFTDPLLALEHFRNNSKDFALVISDIRMPSMNGYELIRKIKAERPTIKTILISAFEINKEEFSKIMPTVKIDSFITKPISLKQLIHSIENSLKEKKMERKSIKNNGY
ncbi:MAG TPA: response regulator [Nitrososphaeraceae archaeon]|nr:response regulator [Nitrososphaeraceae archaeon]